jgi:riboflavin synthase
MFTGIVTDVGTIESVSPLKEGIKLRVATSYDPATIDMGASISHSGICLTVTGLPGEGSNGRWFEVEAWEEALRLTTIAHLERGQPRQSRALAEDRRRTRRPYRLRPRRRQGRNPVGHGRGDATRYRLRAPEHLAKFVAPKGSIALDGTSLTVNAVEGTDFDVLLIRHTLEVTTWGARKAGDFVNFEVDTMARYAARLAEFPTAKAE